MHVRFVYVRRDAGEQTWRKPPSGSSFFIVILSSGNSLQLVRKRSRSAATGSVNHNQQFSLLQIANVPCFRRVEREAWASTQLTNQGWRIWYDKCRRTYLTFRAGKLRMNDRGGDNEHLEANVPRKGVVNAMSVHKPLDNCVWILYKYILQKLCFSLYYQLQTLGSPGILQTKEYTLSWVGSVRVEAGLWAQSQHTLICTPWMTGAQRRPGRDWQER